MAINAKAGSLTPRELIPAGSHIARCYQMLHIGTVTDVIMGEEKVLNKVRITFEVPGEMRVFNEENGEQPMVIDKEYNLSMNPKSNLRRDLESWRGQGFTEDEADNFDITKLLGIACMISIVHKTSKKGNDYATISSISGLPKGVECPKQINPTFEFNYDDKFDPERVEKFPDFIKDAMKSSEEYKKRIDELMGEEQNKNMVTGDELEAEADNLKTDPPF